MEIRRCRQQLGRNAAVGLAIGLIAILGGCKENPVNAPLITGPSERALSFLLTADPDIVLVGSTSAIGVNIRDRNGAPIPGVRVFVESTVPIVIDDTTTPPTIADVDSSSVGCGHLDRSFLVTNGNGIAAATFFADGACHGLLVHARPVGTDFIGNVDRTVSIAIAVPIS